MVNEPIEQPKPMKEDFTMVELAKSLYLLVKMLGGSISIKREKIKGLTNDHKLYIDYDEEKDAYQMNCDVKPNRDKIVQLNRQLVIPHRG